MSKSEKDFVIRTMYIVPIVWLLVYYFLIGPLLSSQLPISAHAAAVGAIISAGAGFIVAGFLLFRSRHRRVTIPLVCIICSILFCCTRGLTIHFT